MRRFRPAVLLVAALALLAGCGDDTNDYRGQVKEVQDTYLPRIKEQTEKATSQLTANPSAAAASLAELQATASEFADRVAAVEAPEGDQELADGLVRAYRQLGEAAAALRTAVESNDTAGLQRALEQFNEAAQAESAAIDALNAR